MSLKTKIIHIINHPPAYEAYENEPRPKINWDTPDGSWVGIWGYDWADQIANECLKITDEFEHEVWQPDLRADKIYSHTFDNGLTHRMFPAQMKSYWYGLLRKQYVFSNEIIHSLKEVVKERKIILHLSITGNFNLELLSKFIHIPIVGTFHGEISLPQNNLYKLRKNFLAFFSLIKQQKLYNALVNNYDFITYQSDKNLKFFREIYHGPTKKISMGCDFKLFRKKDKILARRELGLPEKKKIILSVCRLDPLKQIDKLINIFNKIENTYDFLYLVVGNGSNKYMKYIIQKSETLLKKGKINFIGYKRGDELVNYYNSADLFVNVSKSEAGPVVSMEALACEIPIMTTEVGNVAEFLKENNAGIIVDVKNFLSWENAIISFLNGEKIKIINRNIAFNKYDWSIIANEFLKIYEVLKKRNKTYEYKRIL